jgi:farnesyl-diphosphate farnesyltransferase
VGEFWTKMCRAHLFPRAPLDDSFLLTNGVRFGKGLQLVNILRDVPRDLRQGRCYFPEPELKRVGLAPSDLLNAAGETRFRPLYDRWLSNAEAHLRAAWDYTNALRGSSVRVRLACAWPILIGVKTLSGLRTGNVLDSARRIKVSRGAVWRVIVRSVASYPVRGEWKNMFDRAAV